MKLNVISSRKWLHVGDEMENRNEKKCEACNIFYTNIFADNFLPFSQPARAQSAETHKNDSLSLPPISFLLYVGTILDDYFSAKALSP